MVLVHSVHLNDSDDGSFALWSAYMGIGFEYRFAIRNGIDILMACRTHLPPRHSYVWKESVGVGYLPLDKIML